MMYDLKDFKPILVGDIGGTHANFGIVSCKDGRYYLHESYQLPSQDIADFTQAVVDLVEKIAREKHLTFSVMVIGVAAHICGREHAVKPTHLNFHIRTADLISATAMTEVILINDFIEVACGYPWVDKTLALNDVPVKKGAQQAFIGAGTGLGLAYNVWSKNAQTYIPCASEGGHAEFVVYDHFDKELVAFMQEKYLNSEPITWEQVLCGRGIGMIYAFLATEKKYAATPIAHEIENHTFQPDLISQYATFDEQCKKVFDIYVSYYARFAKEVALLTAPCAGLYIAGGIAAKNKDLFFARDFMRIFTRHTYHHQFLKKIPIFLIQDYQVSLYGGAHYYTLLTKDLV